MALKNTIDANVAATRLADWLATKLTDAQDIRVTDVAVPGAAGMSNMTVLFSATWRDGGGGQQRKGMVARVQPESAGVFPTYDLRKEATIMRAVGENTAVPMPQIYFYEEDPSVLGSPFLVMQRVEGRVPADDPPFTAAGWVLDLSPTQRRQMWTSGIDALARIHSVDWRSLGLGFLDDPEHTSALDAQLAWWRAMFDWAAEGEPNPTIESALTWLQQNRPDDGEKVLNWGDARVGNIIFADGVAAAVLDWEMAALASREHDLGWWLFVMRHHTEGIGMALPEGVPDRTETIAIYEQVSGHRVRNLDYYEVFGGTRLAIIMVRAAHMMISGGMLPPNSAMALNNPASQLVAKLLNLPAPIGAVTSYIGNRGQ